MTANDGPRDQGGAGGQGASLGSDPPASSILDTNVLVSSTASQRELHQVAQDAVQWSTLGRRTYLSGQILREYLVVATRPLESNGLGLTCAEAVANVSAFRSLMQCLEENEEVQERLTELVLTHECRGVVIHDANIVATALTHGVPAIVTENREDFRKFDHLVEVIPLSSFAYHTSSGQK